MKLEFVKGDITKVAADAIVNAANSALSGGGGVDGAIHRAGGPEIMAELQERYRGGCAPGRSVVTKAGALPAKYVFHAVGPVWDGGSAGEAERLASAYRSCLEHARELQVSSIAFPSISTGAYRYPLEKAARIAVETVREFQQQHGCPERVIFVLFSDRDLDVYQRAAQL